LAETTLIALASSARCEVPRYPKVAPAILGSVIITAGGCVTGVPTKGAGGKGT